MTSCEIAMVCILFKKTKHVLRWHLTFSNFYCDLENIMKIQIWVLALFLTIYKITSKFDFIFYANICRIVHFFFSLISLSFGFDFIHWDTVYKWDAPLLITVQTLWSIRESSVHFWSSDVTNESPSLRRSINMLLKNKQMMHISFIMCVAFSDCLDVQYKYDFKFQKQNTKKINTYPSSYLSLSPTVFNKTLDFQ